MKRSQVSIVFGLLNLRERTGVSLVGQRIYTPLERFVRTNSDNFSRSFRRQAFGKWFNDLVENCRVHILIIPRRARNGTERKMCHLAYAHGYNLSPLRGYVRPPLLHRIHRDRHRLTEEPYEVILHLRICAGDGQKWPSYRDRCVSFD